MLGMFNMFNMLVDVYIQYVVLVFKWFLIISNVQYSMLFRNVSYECFQSFLGGIVYVYVEFSIKCTLGMFPIIRNVQ